MKIDTLLEYVLPVEIQVYFDFVKIEESSDNHLLSHLDKKTKKVYCTNWNLTAKDTSYTTEFAAFLKEVL